MSAIEADRVCFSWQGGERLLDECSFTIPRGQLWMLLGANGSGKSTLLKLMAGLLAPTSGQIIVQGTVGFVFQNPDHQLVMPTVGSDIAFSLGGQGLSYEAVQERVRAALQAVDLDGYQRRPIYALSGGQKQRVAIAGELARQTEILLLDEPTALLDRDYQLDLVRLVRRLVDERGLTALWVTHRLQELDYADGALLLERGKIVDQGKPDRLRQQLEELV
ncbi:MAG: energy-coupling factor ABC transporter ATP-binding protein [Pseudanabaenaceae cyanobacterium SKYG29]|nr:energy-coupling factor ABC transporter ATP-binding protein [Pseudanabaenaceae cyanobacterium SKYG29]